MLSRRDFLQSSSLISLAPTVPGFLARTARAASPRTDGRVLVVIQLDGGNDGVNTVVPFADEGYAKYRRDLRLPKERLVKISASAGLHPSLGAFGKLLEKGQLAVVQGVGYPNPNRSHFESMAIWHSARLKPKERAGTGWLGTALDALPRPQDGSPDAVLAGLSGPPRALCGNRSVTSALAHLDDLALDGEVDPKQALAKTGTADGLQDFVRRALLDGYATADRLKQASHVKDTASYPDSGLGQSLRLVARLLKAGFGTRVFYAIQASYDTHYAQLTIHGRLLAELGGAVKAFLDDLTASRLADRVAVLLFSEFGRTVKENGSAGTDHGTAAPVFLAGAPIKAGLVGPAPNLLDLDPRHGDLRIGVDFRQVYATALEDWLGLPAKNALGGSFERLPLFKV
jgi:uncharacterized protein (DUF1501 family)